MFTKEIFHITDRYGNTDYFMCQELPGQNPFYFIQKGKYKTQAVETANNDIDVIISHLELCIKVTEENPPSTKQENIIEIYQYFNELEREFLKKMIDYKNSINNVVAA